jgi:hypothetical protein
MSRGQISTEKLNDIGQKLPSLSEVMRIVRILSPDTISLKCGPKSRVPIAAVCLNDTLSTLGEAKYALREAYAHEVWYQEESQPPNELTSNYFIRFYCDDVTLRLYAAGEHLAHAILAMIPTNRNILKKYRTKRISLAASLGKYLMLHRPKHSITKSVARLAESNDWKRTLEYRGLWVHEQPPLVSGFGIQWRRNVRWEEINVEGTVTGHRLYGGGSGDKPGLSVQELRTFVVGAFSLFVEVFNEVLQFYMKVLSRKRIRLKGNSLRVKLH